MNDKNKVVVRIYGQEYTMAGKESREYMLRIANYVDEKMTDIADNSKKLSTTMIAVLTALNIADESYKKKEKIVELEKELKECKKRYEESQRYIEQLKKEAAEPSKELQQVHSQLTKMKEELEVKEKEYTKIIEQLKEENRKLSQSDKRHDRKEIELEKLKMELQAREVELEKAKKMNDDLQNKLFDSQIKYMQKKKELDAFIETFDQEKNA